MLFKFNLKFLLLALITLITIAEAVDLFQYTDNNCNRSPRVCRNIQARTCCQSRTRDFNSGRCRGCGRRDSHTNWRRGGNNFCATAVQTGDHDDCISHGMNLRGHTWQRRSGGVTEGGDADYTCIAAVEPDAVKIGSRWFNVNASMPEADRDALWNLSDQDVMADESVPANLLQYETEVDAPAQEQPDEEAPDEREEGEGGEGGEGSEGGDEAD